MKGREGTTGGKRRETFFPGYELTRKGKKNCSLLSSGEGGRRPAAGTNIFELERRKEKSSCLT